MSLKVTVEENFDGEVKKMEIEIPFDGQVEEIAEVFRTIMYFLTFVEGTVNDLITSNEDLAEIRDERIEDLKNKYDEEDIDEDFGCGDPDCTICGNK